MLRDLEITLRSFLTPLTSARSLRISALLAVLFLITIFVLYALDWLDRRQVTSLAEYVVLPGLPLIAVLLSEMALRDGITHRTLLYPLLGPVPRSTMAVVRTLATGSILALGAGIVLGALHVATFSGFDAVPREAWAVLLGALAYTSLFGAIHLLWRRGMMAAMVVFALDFTIARLPFSVREIAPSYHLRVLADLEDVIEIPISVELSDPSMWQSSVFLILLAAAGTTASALLFRRKPLGELC